MAYTSPRSWVAGEVVTAALLNAELRDNMLELNGTASAWTAYAPVWTAGTTPTLSTAAGRYKQIGKTVFVHFTVVASGTATLGQWEVSLPVQGRVLAAAGSPLGYITINTGTYGVCLAGLNTSSLLGAYMLPHGGGGPVTSAVVSGNFIIGVLTYEAA